MGLIDKLRHEFIDIIEWLQPSESDVLAYRFPRHDNEIKMGAKLTVREGQAAVFINEGKLADVFKPGLYTLTTQNLPILSKLKGWKYGFESPYKAEVYFVNMALHTGFKWGTSNPIILRDADFGMVRVRGFGNYVFRVNDPAALLRELVSTDPMFEDYHIDAQFRQVMVSRFSDALGKSGIPVLNLAGNYEQLSQIVMNTIKPEFQGWGIEVVKFYVENLSLPPEVEKAIDKRSEMGALGDLSKYTQYQAAEALRDAARNPSGTGSAGVGLGATVALASMTMSALGQSATPVHAGITPPPMPGTIQYHIGVAGQAAGPFDVTALKAQADKGQMTRDTLVWKPGMNGWTKAGEVGGAAALFQAMPPPLP